MQKLLSFAGLLAFTNAEEASLFLSDEPIIEIVDAKLTEPVSNSGKGFDISTALSSTTASCLKSSGYTTAIVRGWHSNATIDTVGCTSLKTA